MRFSIIARVILILEYNTYILLKRFDTSSSYSPFQPGELQISQPLPPLPLAQMKGSNACGLLEGRDIEASN